MNIVLFGPKGSGKSTVGALLAERLGLPCVETDHLIEELYAAETGAKRTYREIFREHGEKTFRDWERRAVAQAAGRDWHVVITGGGVFMDPESRRSLRGNA